MGHRKLEMEEMNRLTVNEFRAAEKTPVVVVLDNIRSLNNVGSIFRTCDALRIRKLILCGITPVPPAPEIHKTALGAELSVEWQYFDTTAAAIDDLHERGYMVCALEQVVDSVPLQDFHFADDVRFALVLGNEVKGVEQSVINACDVCLEIPQFGTKHSFNVAVTAGIVLWEATKQLILNRV